MKTRIRHWLAVFVVAGMAMTMTTFLATTPVEAQTTTCTPPTPTLDSFTTVGISTDGCTALLVAWGDITFFGPNVASLSVRLTNVGTNFITSSQAGLAVAPGPLTLDTCTKTSPAGVAVPQAINAAMGFGTILNLAPAEFALFQCVANVAECGESIAVVAGALPQESFAGRAVPGLESGVIGTVTGAVPGGECRGPGLQEVLTMTKTGSAQSVPVGDTVMWTLKATNLGVLHLSNVEISDPVPPSLAIVEPLPDGVSYNAATRTVTSSVAVLAPGASHSVSFATTVLTPSQTTNAASVTADGGVYAGAHDDVIGHGSATPPAASVPATPTAGAVPATGLAHTGAETTLAALGLVLVAYGATSLGVRRHLRLYSKVE